MSLSEFCLKAIWPRIERVRVVLSVALQDGALQAIEISGRVRPANSTSTSRTPSCGGSAPACGYNLRKLLRELVVLILRLLLPILSASAGFPQKA